ncbi:MAG TPA: family 16 glycosylhydrolase [Terracidiphilus sp.]|nr:family 16 glycosylhydrolase [Terracidiphilus sp.]
MDMFKDPCLRLTILAVALLAGCGSGSGSTGTGGGGGTTPQAAAPAVSTSTSNGAQNGAVIVSLATTTQGATIYYTLDGSTPTTLSPIYEAPFLVGASTATTLNAMATASGDTNSAVTSKTFAAVPSGTLVWSDEFQNSTSTNAQPNPATWTYDTGTDCCGNNELETYCAWGSTTGPCSTSTPNAFVAPGGGLNIVALNPSASVYTSGRLKSQGLFSFQYGRIEAKMLLPESQGYWPAFWMLGNSITTVNWPACGELDIMEHIDGSNPPPYAGGTPEGHDWIAGSVHGGSSSGSEENGTQQYTASGFLASGWHTYGMIWTKGEIQYYVDGNTYATFKSTDSAWSPTPWPFDSGPEFIILNLAVGGDWPGSPNATTVFPGNMQVGYVRIWAN